MNWNTRGFEIHVKIFTESESKRNKICRPIFRAIIISNLAQRILKNWNIRNSDDYVKTNLQISCTDAHFLAKIYTLESWNAIIEYA